MTYLQAIILGLIQGLTEFLPVSSSGHLAISQALFGIGETALSTIFLHFATLLAIVIYFWSSIRQLSLRQWIGIWLASLPVFVVGFLAIATLVILLIPHHGQFIYFCFEKIEDLVSEFCRAS